MTQFEGLRFNYGEVMRDISLLRRLSEPFIDSSCSGILAACETNLENARLSPANVNIKWEIDWNRPLCTVPSQGKYRASSKQGGVGVYGIFSFIWHIRNTEKAVQRRNSFVLHGVASTSLMIKHVETDALVARWQFEGGDATSPGCHFHSAVNQYRDDGLFPEWLKVPRFPGCLLLPLDGLEFLLGELFQLEWLSHVSKKTHDRDAWSKGQERRLERVLRWQLEQVTSWESTPWMSLKKAKPGIDLIAEA
jgi:hypothetical protein